MKILKTFEAFTKTDLDNQKIVLALAATTRLKRAKVVSSGDLVQQLQGFLKTLGYYLAEPTGEFDAATAAAVRSFQTKAGLTSDGIVGIGTWSKVLAVTKKRAAAPTVAPAAGAASLGDSIQTLWNNTKSLFLPVEIPGASIPGDVAKSTKLVGKDMGRATRAVLGATTTQVANATTGMVSDTIAAVKNWFKAEDTTYLQQPATLLFDGKSLHWMVGGSAKIAWGATSGLTPLNSLDWKSAAMYGAKYEKDTGGPLPQGAYRVGALQKQSVETKTFADTIAAIAATNQDFNRSKFSNIAWGNFRALLTPIKGTNTYGRDHFYIHGGLLPGSHGCIDLNGDIDDFAKKYAAYCALHKTSTIRLDVKYA